MSRHTLAVCERCCKIFVPDRYDTFSYVKVEMTDAVQLIFRAEFCTSCAVDFKSTVEDFFIKKKFTTTAQISINNEEVSGATIVRAKEEKIGE